MICRLSGLLLALLSLGDGACAVYPAKFVCATRQVIVDLKDQQLAAVGVVLVWFWGWGWVGGGAGGGVGVGVGVGVGLGWGWGGGWG